MVLSAPPLHAQYGGIPLEMGFGPSSVFPISLGTPVYSVGDQLWVTSDFGGAVGIQVSNAAAPGAGIQAVLQPGVPTYIHTFNSTDAPGEWAATVGGNQETVYFVLSPPQAPPQVEAAPVGFTGSSADINVTALPGVQFYDGQACALGGGDNSAAYVTVPQAVGGGEVELTLANRTVQATGVGLGNSSFGMSLELQYPYSFASAYSPSVYFTRDALVSRSTSAILSRHNASAPLTLQGFGTSRPGVYEVLAVFQGPGGPSLSQTSVLLLADGSWVWLGGCAQSPVDSGTFQMKVPLGGVATSWPRSVLLTYKVAGVEGYAVAGLGAVFAEVSFVAEPWGAALRGYSISVSSPGSIALGVSNSTVFGAFSAGKAPLNFSVSLGGETVAQGSVDLLPYSAIDVQVALSALHVVYQKGGTPVEGGLVVVSAGGKNLTSATTGTAGDADFYLPAGAYDVAASGGGAPARGTVTLTAGTEGELLLGTGAAPIQVSNVDMILGAALVAGILVNAGLWARRRRFRRRLARSQIPLNSSQM